MALDFFILENNEYLFGLDSSKYANLETIFESYKRKTGIYIDEYRDTLLSVSNQKVLLKIIDEYVTETDLNVNKIKTTSILEFRGLLSFFISKNYSLKLAGD